MAGDEQNSSLSWFWFLRRGGDVIVIGLEKDSGAQRGRVIAVLKAREMTPHG
jgi:leucine-rich repeat kinase 1